MKLSSIFKRNNSCPLDLSTMPWSNQASHKSQFIQVLGMLFHLGLYVLKWLRGIFGVPARELHSCLPWWAVLAENPSWSAEPGTERQSELLEMTHEVSCYREWITWTEHQFRELEIHSRWNRPVCARAELGKGGWSCWGNISFCFLGKLCEIFFLTWNPVEKINK